MGIYGKAAIQARWHVLQSKASSPAEAWKLAVAAVTSKGSSRQKVCPKNAFLGLCEAGVVLGIPAGRYGARGNKNGRYALNAYRLLISEPNLSTNKAILWAKAIAPEPKKRENEQMDVVLSLWSKKLLQHSS